MQTLQQARESKFLSYNALRDRTGIAVTTLIAIERGAKPRLETIQRIAHALDIDPATIAWPGHSVPPSNPVFPKIQAQLDSALLDLYKAQQSDPLALLLHSEALGQLTGSITHASETKVRLSAIDDEQNRLGQPYVVTHYSNPYTGRMMRLIAAEALPVAEVHYLVDENGQTNSHHLLTLED